VIDICSSLNLKLHILKEQQKGKTIKVNFLGELVEEQQNAVEAILKHDTGILAAATGFGKTVVGASIIAQRGVNTLILVHRKQLLEQWKE